MTRLKRSPFSRALAVAALLSGLAFGMQRASAADKTAAHAPKNLLINGSFEEGEKGWLLNYNKLTGGKVVAEADKNHTLYAEGETYWMANSNHRVFVKVPREKFEGKKLRVMFRAKAEDGARPGIILVYSTGTKQVYANCVWTGIPVPPGASADGYSTYDVFYNIPSAAKTLTGVALYNIPKRGKLWVDDISMTLVAAAPAAPAAK